LLALDVGLPLHALRRIVKAHPRSAASEMVHSCEFEWRLAEGHVPAKIQTLLEAGVDVDLAFDVAISHFKNYRPTKLILSLGANGRTALWREARRGAEADIMKVFSLFQAGVAFFDTDTTLHDAADYDHMRNCFVHLGDYIGMDPVHFRGLIAAQFTRA